MKKRRVLVSLLCAAAMLGVSTSALTSCKNKKEPETPEVPIIQKFTVIFESNGGSAVNPINNIEDGSKINKPKDPTRTGYNFAGWYKEATLTNEWKFDTDIVTATTKLYARWTPKSEEPTPVEAPKATLVYNNGTANGTLTATKTGEKYYYEQPAKPEKEGSTFLYWCSDEELKNKYDFTAEAVDGIKLYANWEENEPVPVEAPKATLVYNNGTANGTLTATKTGEKYYYEQPAKPEKEGSTFLYWCSDEELKNKYDFAAEAVDGIKLYANWDDRSDDDKSAYELFVDKGNIVYASNYEDANEEIIDEANRDSSITNQWIGNITGDDGTHAFSDNAKLEIQNNKLVLVDKSTTETTTAYMELNPMLYSTIEIETTLQVTKISGSWSIMRVNSWEGSLIDLRTGSGDNKNKIYYRTLVLDENQAPKDSDLLGSGFTYVQNKDINIKISIDLSTLTAEVTLTQETNTVTYNVELVNASDSGFVTIWNIQFMTAKSDAERSILVDWFGVRVAADNLDAFKEFALSYIDANYELKNTEDYSQMKTELDDLYEEAKTRIPAAEDSTQLLNIMNELLEKFNEIYSDDELAALEHAQEVIEQLKALKEEKASLYTIEALDEEDWFHNKKQFEELFEFAINNLSNCTSVSEIDAEYERVVDNLNYIRTDSEILAEYRNEIKYRVFEWVHENGYSYYLPAIDQQILTPLSDELKELDSKQAMLAKYDEVIASIVESYETDEEVVANMIEMAVKYISRYANDEIALINPETAQEVLDLIAQEKQNAITLIEAVATSDGTVYEKRSMIYEYEDTATNEINRLISTAGKSLEELQTEAREALWQYIQEKLDLYDHPEDLEETLITIFEATYKVEEDIVVINGWAECETQVVLEQYSDSKTQEVNDAISAYEFKLIKEAKASYLEEIVLPEYQNMIYSTAVQAEMEELVTENYLSQVDNALNVDDLDEIETNLRLELQAIVDSIADRKFTVTYDNAVGSIEVGYGQQIDITAIHVTGMIVTDIKYNDEIVNEENPLEIYDDLTIALVYDGVNEITESVSWSAADHGEGTSGTFISNDLFEMSYESTYAWLEKNYSEKYSIAFQSNNYNDSTQTPIIITIKENLASLKLTVGLGDSSWSSTRSGLISFTRNGEKLEEVGDANNRSLFIGEVVLTNLHVGDKIEVIAHTLNSGSRIYVFDAEASVDFTAVPKTISVKWSDLDNLTTIHNHLETISIPTTKPEGEGAFQYWYYIEEDENGVEQHIQIPENWKLEVGTNITVYAYFKTTNVNITYVDGKTSQTVPYSVDDDNKPTALVVEGYNTEIEEFVGWYNEDGTEFDFDTVETPEEGTIAQYTVYAKWYDLAQGKKDLTPHSCDYATMTTLPTSDDYISFTGDRTSLNTTKHYLSLSSNSNNTNYIKIVLTTTSKIEVKVGVENKSARIMSIHNTAQKATTSDDYVLNFDAASSADLRTDTLIANDLAAGTYYINWSGSGCSITKITITGLEEFTIKYSGISGTPVTEYSSGEELALDLTGLTLNASEAEHSVALSTVKDDLTIDVDDAFYAGTAGEYEVTITYGNHCSYSYTVNVGETTTE